MNLKQLIYKRLVHAKDIGELLAKYAGRPAVFDTEAPDDKQDGWEGKRSTQGSISSSICRQMRNVQA